MQTLLTKYQEVALDTSIIWKEIESNEEQPFASIKMFKYRANATLDRLAEADRDEDGQLWNALLDYKIYLNSVAIRAFIQHRATKTEKKLRARFTDPIKVFSVSAGQYMQHLYPGDSKPFLSVEETGIPALRRYLLGIPAEKNWRSYQDHLNVKVPQFIDKARRISNDNKQDDSYAKIRPMFDRLVKQHQDNVERCFETFSRLHIVPLFEDVSQRDRRLKDLLEVVQGWSEGTRPNTYNLGLREFGIMKTKAKKYQGEPYYGHVNWNDDVSTKLLADVEKWLEAMVAAIEKFAEETDDLILQFCDTVHGAINEAPITPKAKLNAVEEWNKRQEHIHTQSARLGDLLKAAAQSTYQYATTETDIRCMNAEINMPVFQEVHAVPPPSQGRYGRQKEAMIAAMEKPDASGETLIDRIQAKVLKSANNNLSNEFAKFVTALFAEVNLFNEHIGEYMEPKYKLTSADRELRQRLKDLIPELERRNEEAKKSMNDATVPGASLLCAFPQDTVPDNVFVKQEPKDDDDDSSPIMKKQKTSDHAGDAARQYWSQKWSF